MGNQWIVGFPETYQPEMYRLEPYRPAPYWPEPHSTVQLPYFAGMDRRKSCGGDYSRESADEAVENCNENCNRLMSDPNSNVLSCRCWAESRGEKSYALCSEKLLELIKINQLNEGIIYLQATRGVAHRTHSFPATETASVINAYTTEITRPTEKIEKGMKIISIDDIRWLRCDIKTINLLGNVLAKQAAVEHKVDDVIQVRDGIVTEGSASNFFIVKEGLI